MQQFANRGERDGRAAGNTRLRGSERLRRLVNGARDHHFSRIKNLALTMMENLELSDEEAVALIRELDQLINRAKYPFSDRVRTLSAILARLKPEPPQDPPKPRRVYGPPSHGRYRQRG